MFNDERCRLHLQPSRFATVKTCWLVLCIVAQSGDRCFAIEDSDVIARFAVRNDGSPMTLPVTIGENTYPFGFDTGSSISIFDTSLRALLGRPARPIGVTTLTGTHERWRYAAPPMRVGSFHARLGDVFCLDVREDSLIFGNDVFGVIGQDFLSDKIFRIDFGCGRIEFLNRLEKPRGERLALTWKLGAPFVAVDLPVVGKEAFLIDTGATGFGSGAISEAIFRRLLAASELNELAKRRARGVSPTGTVHSRQARSRRFKVGPFEHQGLIFSESNMSHLGLGYLSRYLVTFDLAHSAVYLEPGRGYQNRDRCHLADFTVVRFEGKTKIWPLELKADGVTAPSGVQSMDELISIDRLQAASASIFEIQRLLCTPGERKIRVQQVDGEREFSITLKEPPELPAPSLRSKR